MRERHTAHGCIVAFEVKARVLFLVTQPADHGALCPQSRICRTCTATSCLVVLFPATFSFCFSADSDWRSAAAFFSAFFAALFAAFAAAFAAVTAFTAASTTLACCTAFCFDAVFSASTSALAAIFDAHLAATAALSFLL